MSNLPKISELTDDVLVNFNEQKETGMIDIPDNYSAENAMKAAYFILKNTKNKDKKPVLTTCSISSIKNSLFYMVTNGLNPAKNQCYFIPYGNELRCSESYQGKIMLAKRYSKVQSVNANVIYEKDIFTTEIMSDGREVLKKHETAFENCEGKIIGAYCVVIDSEGLDHLTKMTIGQIKLSWLQGFGEQNVHKNFTDEMSKKTVISRAMKKWISSSTDENIINQPEQLEDTTEDQEVEEIQEMKSLIPEQPEQAPENKTNEPDQNPPY